MVIDHVGLFFFPQFFFLRMIGRLAFPLFAWFIANGARYTSNVKVYLLRLFVLALITQPLYWYACHLADISQYLNVVFTLCLGLVAIMLMQRTSNRWLWLIATLACAAIATICNTDYGAEGVLSIAAFHVFRNNFRYVALSQAVITGILPMITFQLWSKGVIDLSGFYLNSPIEYIGLLSLIAIYFYNNKPGIRAKYLFYGFYFFQFVAIIAVSLLLVYGKPYYSVVRLFTSQNSSLVFIGNPGNDAGKCDQENKRVADALRKKCPRCLISLSECRKKLYPSWEAAVHNKPDDVFTVRTDTGHILIEAAPSVADKICREMASEINAQKRQHAECISSRARVLK